MAILVHIFLSSMFLSLAGDTFYCFICYKNWTLNWNHMMFVQLGVMFNNLFNYLIFVMHLYHLPLSVIVLVQLHSLSPLSKFSSSHFFSFSLSLSRSQCATVGRMQTAAAAGMKRRGCGSAWNASKWDRSGLQGGRQMMLLWIILSSSLSLMVDGQMKIPPETWVPQNQQRQQQQ